MNLAPMRYKDYVWPHNPETYTISFKRQVAVAKVPFGRYGMQDLGMSYRVMEGEGVFAGKGAYDEFKKLASVFYQGGPGLLIHPVWQASQAYFVLLELAQQPLEIIFYKQQIRHGEHRVGGNRGLAHQCQHRENDCCFHGGAHVLEFYLSGSSIGL